MHKLNEIGEMFLLAISIVLAMIGGIVKEIAEREEENKHIDCYGVGTQALIGAFSGGVTALLLMEYQLSNTMIIVGSMVGGYWGVGVLVYIRKIITSRVDKE